MATSTSHHPVEEGGGLDRSQRMLASTSPGLHLVHSPRPGVGLPRSRARRRSPSRSARAGWRVWSERITARAGRGEAHQKARTKTSGPATSVCSRRPEEGRATSAPAAGREGGGDAVSKAKRAALASEPMLFEPPVRARDRRGGRLADVPLIAPALLNDTRSTSSRVGPRGAHAADAAAPPLAPATARAEVGGYPSPAHQHPRSPHGRARGRSRPGWRGGGERRGSKRQVLPVALPCGEEVLARSGGLGRRAGGSGSRPFQAEEESGETAGGHLLAQVALVAERPHVDGGARRPHRSTRRSPTPQSLSAGERDVGDLSRRGCRVGQLEATGAIGLGVGEGAATWPKSSLSKTDPRGRLC